jgi:hypothetical protein
LRQRQTVDSAFEIRVVVFHIRPGAAFGGALLGTAFGICSNLKTAKVLGLTVLSSLFARADEVIKDVRYHVAILRAMSALEQEQR